MSEFADALAEFRSIVSTITMKSWSGGARHHENLTEFHHYWGGNKKQTRGRRAGQGLKNGVRCRPTRTEEVVPKKKLKYKKSGIPSKIKFPRADDPRLWARQYAWFKIHPEADVYNPQKNGRPRKSS